MSIKQQNITQKANQKANQKISQKVNQQGQKSALSFGLGLLFFVVVLFLCCIWGMELGITSMAVVVSLSLTYTNTWTNTTGLLRTPIHPTKSN